MKKANLIIGTLLVALGIIYALSTFNIIEINLFFKGWWTLIIIIPSLIGLINDDDKIGNLIGLIIGVLLLLASNNIITYKVILKLIIPIILVTVGISLILKDRISQNIKQEIKEIDRQNNQEYYATFSSNKIDFEKENLKSSNLTATFGELKCNLKEAQIKENIVLTVTSVFGKITIESKEDINIKLAPFTIFGDVSDKRPKNKKNTIENKPTIYIDGICMFGSVEIK